MKKTSLLLLFILNVLTMSAQDTIVMRNGSDVACRVREVAPAEVLYTVYGVSDSAQFSVQISEVKEIRFSSGSRMMFDTPVAAAPDQPVNQNEIDSIAWLNMNQGMRDADMYYRGQKSGAGAVAATTIILTPVVGLIPAIIVASSPPKEKNLNMPYKGIRENKDYRDGYAKQAHHIKKKVVWISFGSATLSWILLIALLA